MKTILASLALIAVTFSPGADAKKRAAAWQVVRAADPITRASTCAVVASDYVGKTRFTQIGALYPVVEMNSTYGLLVGVSSGGRFRLPTGDIIWSVDERPHRQIRAADNPSQHKAVTTPPVPRATVEELTEYAKRLTQQMTATSTMASGAKAREMLDEMLAGQSLLFRAEGSGPQTGLPDYSALVAGQRNEKGDLKPIPLDGSFREGLRVCGMEIEPGG